MAQPKKQSSPNTSAVASCAATDCSHNEDRSCVAGSIEVTMQGGRATCGTYSPGKPKARP
ncbi:MAG: DUF1540 domain-containing protein [Gemmatimonadota bacterium]